MKTALLFLISFGLCTISAAGQNKVTVKQQGDGNSVSISQSSGTDAATDCDQSMTARNHEANQILVFRKGAHADTIANQSSLQKNIVDNPAELPLFSATQKGNVNLLFIQLTDIYGIINTDQAGENNYISAQLDSSSHQLSLSQKGSNNTININPCSNNEK